MEFLYYSSYTGTNSPKLGQYKPPVKDSVATFPTLLFCE